MDSWFPASCRKTLRLPCSFPGGSEAIGLRDVLVRAWRASSFIVIIFYILRAWKTSRYYISYYFADHVGTCWVSGIAPTGTFCACSSPSPAGKGWWMLTWMPSQKMGSLLQLQDDSTPSLSCWARIWSADRVGQHHYGLVDHLLQEVLGFLQRQASYAPLHQR